jgi:hypothetical protein
MVEGDDRRLSISVDIDAEVGWCGNHPNVI